MFHASSVALVLNPCTGHVSPQYHVAFDNYLSTVPHMRANTVPKNWSDLVNRRSECVTEEKIDPDETWFRQDLSANSVASEPQETDLQQSKIENKDTPYHPSPLPTTQVNEGETIHRADTTPETREDLLQPATRQPTRERQLTKRRLISMIDRNCKCQP